jgi:diguanylate cyclase (GGDEF)-like protein/PAS domain S-box-containing protein
VTLGSPIPPLRPEASEEAELLSKIIDTQNDLASVELDRRIILQVVGERAQTLAAADGAAVELLENGHLLLQSGSGILKSHEGKRLSLAGSLAGRAIQSGQCEYADDTEADPRVDRMVCRDVGLRSLVAVPLFHGERPIGVLVVVSTRPRAFAPKYISAIRLMAGLVAASLIHASEFEIKKRLLAERTRALIALRESQERFGSAFEHAAIGMALVALDGRWLQVNPAGCQIVGYTESELLVRDFQSITFPADLEADLAFVRRLIAGELRDYQMVKRYVHRQGHLVWVLLSVSLVRDEAANPLYFIAQMQDITQRQRAEAALQASEEEYRAIFELAGVGKVQTELATGRFTRVNQKFCQIIGYSADELCCLSFAQITHPDDLQKSTETAQQMFTGQISDHSFEKRYIRKTGEVVWVSLNSTVLKDANGRSSRAVATIVDITDRKHAEWLERDRRMVLEKVARHMPLPEVLAQLAEAVQRQIEKSVVAVMVLSEGRIALHGSHLPEGLQVKLNAHCLSIATHLSQGVWNSGDACGVTDIESDPIWNELRAEALGAGLTTCWSVVIRAVDGTTLGLLTVFCPRRRRPSRGEIHTLEMVSQLATICIEHHQAAGQLSHLVRHDPLTGLPNRLMFEDRAQHALAMSRRTDKQVGLMVLDIDKFKSINDTLGHQAGDHLLQQFAQRLRTQLRETDTMARIGGDEFVIVLPELSSRQAAEIIARKLVNSLEEPFALAGRLVRATCSIGIAVFPDDGEDAVTLQKQADAALYRVKERGRNGFSF